MPEYFFQIGNRAVASADADQMPVTVRFAERRGKLNVVERLGVCVAVGERQRGIELLFCRDEIFNL